MTIEDVERGRFRCIMKLNLPPEKQYHSGHSLIVQGDTLREIEESLAEKVGEGRAVLIIEQFFENVTLGAVKDGLGTPTETAEEPKASADGAESTTSTHGAPATSKPASDDDGTPSRAQVILAMGLGIDPAGHTKASLKAAIQAKKGA